MLDVSLLGTGGMMPLPRRHITSLMVRCGGNELLIDCGEGTQTALREKGWSFKPVNTICLTHFHADHIAGLPGFFLTMGNADRTEPVTVIGPKGVSRIIAAVRVIAPELPFEVRTVEIEENEQTFEVDGLLVTAFKVKHTLPCYAYEIVLKRTGRFDADRAKAQGIPLKFWSRLQKGETIIDGGITYTPDMVLGEERKGLKVVYATDTRPTDDIARHAKDADLFICEGMYGEPGMDEKAKKRKHMTMQEAARLARAADPKELWLTHYSPSLVRPESYMDSVRAIFKRSIAARDGQEATLLFEED